MLSWVRKRSANMRRSLIEWKISPIQNLFLSLE